MRLSLNINKITMQSNIMYHTILCIRKIKMKKYSVTLKSEGCNTLENPISSTQSLCLYSLFPKKPLLYQEFFFQKIYICKNIQMYTF